MTIPKSEVAVSRRPSTSTKTNKLARNPKLTTHEERDGPPGVGLSLSDEKVTPACAPALQGCTEALALLPADLRRIVLDERIDEIADVLA